MERNADSVHDCNCKEHVGANNRRRHLRLPLPIPVRFHLPDHQDRIFAGRTQNLSDSGLMLVAGDPLPPGSTISLELLFKDTEVSLEGEVIWSRRSDPSVAQSGIQFRFPPDQGFANQLFMRYFLGQR